MASGVARQQVAALSAAPRFHEAALLQARQDQLQKLLRDFLTPRYVGDFDGFAGLLERQVENGVQGVIAFHGDVHAGIYQSPHAN